MELRMLKLHVKGLYNTTKHRRGTVRGRIATLPSWSGQRRWNYNSNIRSIDWFSIAFK